MQATRTAEPLDALDKNSPTRALSSLPRFAWIEQDRANIAAGGAGVLDREARRPRVRLLNLHRIINDSGPGRSGAFSDAHRDMNARDAFSTIEKLRRRSSTQGRLIGLYKKAARALVGTTRDDVAARLGDFPADTREALRTCLWAVRGLAPCPESAGLASFDGCGLRVARPCPLVSVAATAAPPASKTVPQFSVFSERNACRDVAALVETILEDAHPSIPP